MADVNDWANEIANWLRLARRFDNDTGDLENARIAKALLEARADGYRDVYDLVRFSKVVRGGFVLMNEPPTKDWCRDPTLQEIADAINAAEKNIRKIIRAAADKIEKAGQHND